MTDGRRIIIIGAGPAGIFCAHRLKNQGYGIEIFEQGKNIPSRKCPPGDKCECNTCAILCGVGGAGGFSDGKIALTSLRGTQTERIFKQDCDLYIRDLETAILKYAKTFALHKTVDELPEIFGKSKLIFESYPMYYLGTVEVRKFIKRMVDDTLDLKTKLRYGVRVDEIIAAPHDIIVVASGGSAWSTKFLLRNNLLVESGTSGFGIRLEMPERIMKPLIDIFYDYKLYNNYDQYIQLRSFCVNGSGHVLNENHKDFGIITVNGRADDKKTERSNLAIIAKIHKSPFCKDPKKLVINLAKKVNNECEGYPLRQATEAFVCETQRQAPVVGTNPKSRVGRLQTVLPSSLTSAFQAYLLELDKLIPGAATHPESVIYAPEIKYFPYCAQIDENFQVKGVPNLYVIGNATGVLDSFSAAALSGMIAGDAIIKKGGDA